MIFNTSYDFTKNALSLSTQNKAIEHVENGRWLQGRAVGLAKSVALVYDVAVRLLSSVANTGGYTLVNPYNKIKCYFTATQFNQSYFFADIFNDLGAAVLFSFDILPSVVVNVINPRLYPKMAAQNNQKPEEKKTDPATPQRAPVKEVIPPVVLPIVPQVVPVKQGTSQPATPSTPQPATLPATPPAPPAPPPPPATPPPAPPPPPPAGARPPSGGASMFDAIKNRVELKKPSPPTNAAQPAKSGAFDPSQVLARKRALKSAADRVLAPKQEEVCEAIQALNNLRRVNVNPVPPKV